VGEAFVATAIKAGVRRLVFSSVIHPVLRGLPNHVLKVPVENAVLESQLEYTFLHPTVLFQNYASAWAGIVKTGVVAEPWSNDTRFSRVDYRDVAEVAAKALLEDQLLYGTFELCAEGWLNRHDVAALIGEALGRTIASAKQEIAALKVDDIRDRDIPFATDELDAIVDHTAQATNAILESCEMLDELSGTLTGEPGDALQTATTLGPPPGPAAGWNPVPAAASSCRS